MLHPYSWVNRLLWRSSLHGCLLAYLQRSVTIPWDALALCPFSLYSNLIQTCISTLKSLDASSFIKPTHLFYQDRDGYDGIKLLHEPCNTRSLASCFTISHLWVTKNIGERQNVHDVMITCDPSFIDYTSLITTYTLSFLQILPAWIQPVRAAKITSEMK